MKGDEMEDRLIGLGVIETPQSQEDNLHIGEYFDEEDDVSIDYVIEHRLYW